jgi:mono/diheme cytochrome c family protein
MKALLVFLLTVACIAAEPAEPDGARLFVNYCAACHGAVGEGDGPVAASLAVGVPNLRTLALRNGGEFPESSVSAYIDGRELRAAHGDRQMPIWGDIFAALERGDEDVVAARINAVVRFIETLQYR